VDVIYRVWFRTALKVIFTGSTIYAGVVFQSSRWQFFLFAGVALVAAVFDYILSFQVSSLVRERVSGIIESAYCLLGFTKGDRVRMTIFVPCTSKKNHLKQLIRYYPTQRYGSFRRGLNISKGIIGLCYRKAAPVIESLSQATDFEAHMIEKWGFSQEEASTIRQRKNYMALPIIDKSDNVTAVAYFDSEREAVFTQDKVVQALRVCIPLSKWL
jgi:hypothetical protein